MSPSRPPPLPGLRSRASTEGTAFAHIVRLLELAAGGFLLWNAFGLMFASGFIAGRLFVVAAAWFGLFFVPVGTAAAELSILGATVAAGAALVAFTELDPMKYLFPAVVALVVLCVAFAVLGAVASAIAGRFVARSLPAAVESGDPERLRAAADRAARAARFTWGPPRVKALWTAVRLRQGVGDFAEAAALLDALDRGRRARAEHGQRIASLLSLVLALGGEADAAAAWVSEAKRRQPPPGTDEDRVYLAAEAIAAARKGNAEGAAQRIEEAWPKLERARPVELPPLRIVRAFLLAQAGRPGAEPLPPELIRREASVWLAACWPELAAFVRDQAAGAARPAASAS